MSQRIHTDMLQSLTLFYYNTSCTTTGPHARHTSINTIVIIIIIIIIIIIMLCNVLFFEDETLAEEHNY